MLDYLRLTVFLLASIWLYAALVHALGGWRRNLGRIVQMTSAAALAVWLMFSPLTMEIVLTLSFLFVLTIALPHFIQEQVRTLVERGRTGTIRFWQVVYSALTWSDRSSVFRNSQGMRGVVYGRQDAEPTKSSFQGDDAARFSRRAMEQIEAYVAAQHYEEAITCFERDVLGLGMKPEPHLLYVMTIPYAELGDLEQATSLLRSTEAQARVRDMLYDTRRFLAYVRVYALCGCVSELEQCLSRNSHMAKLLPPSYEALWRAVARRRSGDVAGAQHYFDEAAREIRAKEQRLIPLLERHTTLQAEIAQPVELSPITLSNLEAIRELAAKRPADTAIVLRAKPYVTLALIVVLAIVWAVTEFVGSSVDSRTLLRFGANVPELVNHGEWWRLVSSVFLHVGFIHLFFNAYGCYLFGRFVEQLGGRWATFMIFMFAGIAGSLASVSQGSHTMSAGASGGVFGLIGAATVLAVRFREIFPPRMRSIYVLNFIFIAGMGLASGLIEPLVDNMAHAGGLVAGVLAGFIPTVSGHRWRKVTVYVAGGVLATVLVVAAVFAAKNVWEGGYPKQFMPMKDYSNPNSKWLISLPVSWRVLGADGSAVSFSDPLGVKLVVEELPNNNIRMRLHKQEILDYHGRRRIGANIVEEWHVRVMVDGEWDHSDLRFAIERPGRTCILRFLLNPEEESDYTALVEAIVGSFEMNWRHMFVVRPMLPKPLPTSL